MTQLPRSEAKKLNSWKIVAIALLVIIVVMGAIIGILWMGQTKQSIDRSTFEQTFLIRDETKTLTVNLQANQTVTGSFNITGEGRYDASIDFNVIDPSGVVLIDKTVLNRTDFTFKAFTDGEHKLVFDNYGGYDKYIELAYDVISIDRSSCNSTMVEFFLSYSQLASCFFCCISVVNDQEIWEKFLKDLMSHLALPLLF